MRLSFLYCLQHPESEDLHLEHVGAERVGAVTCEVLRLSTRAGSLACRWYIDPATGRILRAASDAEFDGKTHTRFIDYDGWKVLDGIEVPTSSVVHSTESAERLRRRHEYEINPTITEDTFEPEDAPAPAPGQTSEPVRRGG
jgi:hypothetical protein